MLRETQEEINVIPLQYEKVGIISFDEYVKGNPKKVVFYLYVCDKWEGTPTETEEMAPEWFSTKNVPYNCMFPDDKYWLPLILEGKKIKAYFQFDKDWNLLSHQVEEL